MRTHRKILVTDGRLGFTGGMNVRVGHCLQRQPARPVQDIHFRVQGPVVTHLQVVFADDWLFTTGESLRGEAWFPQIEATGPVLARGVTDGPDENFEFSVECYDAELAQRLDQWIETKRQGAHLVTLAEIDGRTLPARLRDGVARLLTPYL